MPSNIIITHIDARPLKPSMMLMALATPVTHSSVSAIAAGIQTIRWSTPGMSVCKMTASSSQTASAAEKQVASSRQRAATFLVRSSAMPTRNAGRPHAMKTQKGGEESFCVRLSNTLATAIATRTPTPPIRGTARLWNFCGPEKSVSAVIHACDDADRTTSKVVTSEVRNARMKNDIGVRSRALVAVLGAHWSGLQVTAGHVTQAAAC